MNRVAEAVVRRWYGRPGLLRLLWPLSGLYGLLGGLDRCRARPWKAPVPVVVVGNVTVGGTGKTPVVAALVAELAARGLRPGIVSRGHGGEHRRPMAVTADSDPALAGDEPVLLAGLCQCPVWVGRDRVAAARSLLAHHDCDVLVADDGLQHHRLGRDVEWVVVDGQRGLGNGHLLPTGPLRESPRRLEAVDAVLINGGHWHHPRGHRFRLVPTAWVRLVDGLSLPLPEGPRGRVHAVAGIGNPDRFFDSLRALGLAPQEHRFADHHAYRAGDLVLSEPWPVVTTAKDAVKLQRLIRSGELADLPAGLDQLWYLAVRAELPGPPLEALARRLTAVPPVDVVVEE